MNRVHRILWLACALVAPAVSAELKPASEGWTAWQVPAVEGAPAWCCYHWLNRNTPPTTCRLDENHGGHSTHSDNATTDAVKVYAHAVGGKVDKVLALAASCPVETRTAIQQLGEVAPDDSARWLVARVKQQGTDSNSRRSSGEGALGALAIHRGDLALNALTGFAREDAHLETRKLAVFWLAYLRGAAGADVTSSLMFNDRNSELRQHAAFALTQSRSPRVTADLIRLGNTDKVGEVRAQAWFWLAQSGAAEAEKAIGAALRKDSDDDVREQAIFALSQLPDERGTKALIATVEDQSLSREQRRRAVFWLSHSESDSAQAYLEKVLARAAKN